MKQAVLAVIVLFLVFGCGRKEPSSAENSDPAGETRKQEEQTVSEQPGSAEVPETAGAKAVPEADTSGPAETPEKTEPLKTPEQTEAEKKAAELAEEWELVFEDDFSNPDAKDRWEFEGGTWAVENGELVGKGDAAHIAILKKEIVGDVRIEFDVHIDSDFLNDVSCFFSARVEDPKIKTYGTGYLLQYGGYTNTKNDIMRDGFAMAEEKASPLKKGVTYHMAAWRKGTAIAYSIDGKEILKAEDTLMFNSKENCKIGLYAWGGDNYYDNVRIYVPEK